VRSGRRRGRDGPRVAAASVRSRSSLGAHRRSVVGTGCQVARWSYALTRLRSPSAHRGGWSSSAPCGADGSSDAASRRAWRVSPSTTASGSVRGQPGARRRCAPSTARGAKGAGPPRRPGALSARVGRVVPVTAEAQEDAPECAHDWSLGGRGQVEVSRAPGRAQSCVDQGFDTVSGCAWGRSPGGTVPRAGARCDLRSPPASPPESRAIEPCWRGSDARDGACALLAEKMARRAPRTGGQRDERRVWKRPFAGTAMAPAVHGDRGEMRRHAGRRTAMRVRTAVTCAGADDPKLQCGVSSIVSMPHHVGATLSRR
jgi:hypothetical protein